LICCFCFFFGALRCIHTNKIHRSKRASFGGKEWISFLKFLESNKHYRLFNWNSPPHSALKVHRGVFNWGLCGWKCQPPPLLPRATGTLKVDKLGVEILEIKRRKQRPSTKTNELKERKK
jgi:hypothetical protein